MSVLAEAISVIVPNARLESVYPGGVAQYETDCDSPTFCSDGALTRVGFMSPLDTEAFITALEDLGLTFVVDEEFIDIAVVDQLSGPLTRCSWLSFEVVAEGYSHCWSSTTERGTLAVPKGWTIEQSRSFTFTPTEDMAGRWEFVSREEDGMVIMRDRNTGEIAYFSGELEEQANVQTAKPEDDVL